MRPLKRVWADPVRLAGQPTSPLRVVAGESLGGRQREQRDCGQRANQLDPHGVSPLLRSWFIAASKGLRAARFWPTGATWWAKSTGKPRYPREQRIRTRHRERLARAVSCASVKHSGFASHARGPWFETRRAHRSIGFREPQFSRRRNPPAFVAYDPSCRYVPCPDIPGRSPIWPPRASRAQTTRSSRTLRKSRSGRFRESACRVGAPLLSLAEGLAWRQRAGPEAHHRALRAAWARCQPLGRWAS
jgi:hypothetical protein